MTNELPTFPQMNHCALENKKALLTQTVARDSAPW